MTDKQIEKAWDTFLKVADEYGYKYNHHNDSTMGTGTTCWKDDPFIPIIKLDIRSELKIRSKLIDPASMTIFVRDRNGNTILGGEFCAVHTLKDCKGFSKKLKEMSRYVFDKYSKYSRENRLDFVFNGLKMERVDWNDKEAA